MDYPASPVRIRTALCSALLALAALAALAAPVRAQAPIVRPAADEVIYQIMPIAWRDSNLDVTGSLQTRFGDFGGLASTESLDYLQ